MSQEIKVLKHIKRYKKISSMQAFSKYNITRLAAVVYNLRAKGYAIKTDIVNKANSSYAVYSMG
jgi:hypothetical protein